MTSVKSKLGAARAPGAAFAIILAATLGTLACAKVAAPKTPALEQGVRHYRLVDRAVDPVEGAPPFLDVAIPAEYLDTRILPPFPEGETRALFISVPSSTVPDNRYFCRMTYSSPNPVGTVGQEFPIDAAIAPRFGLPEGFQCRKGFDFEDRRMIDYYCEDASARATGGQLETRCHFENPLPTAACILSVRVPSRAYLDCEYSPRDVSRVGEMASDLSIQVERFIRRPADDQREGDAG